MRLGGGQGRGRRAAPRRTRRPRSRWGCRAGGGSVLPVTDTDPGQPGRAAVVKDAGDDPDVTHGAHLTVTAVWLPAERAAGTVELHAGPGVGTVTLPGLGLPVGAPAINPVPARMIRAAVGEVTDRPVALTVSVPGGEAMAARTSNARLGIVGGICILGHHRDRAPVLDGGVAGQRGPAGRRGRGPGPRSHGAVDRRTHRRRRPAPAPGPAGRSASSRSATSPASPCAGPRPRAWPGPPSWGWPARSPSWRPGC